MAAAPNPCDSLEVDLSRQDLNVEIWQSPCIDVEVVHSDVTIEFASVANQGPKGDPGEPGQDGADSTTPGPPGSPGIAATIHVGTTTTGAPGTDAEVSNSGTSSTATFDFLIPRGDVGPTGPAGQGINIKGTVANHAALPASGNSPGDVWITSDTGHGWSWNGTTWVDIGPIQGPKGDTGPSNVLTVSSTTTGAPGTNAAVSIAGTSPSQSLAFTIPAGVQGTAGSAGPTGPTGPAGANSTVPGPAGPTGAAATVAAGPTVTGAPGTNALVTNTGTTSAAVFAFTVPRGDVGAAGATGNAETPGATGSTGPQGPPGPTAVSTDAGNKAILGSDAKIFVPDPTPVIWSQTRRVFNSVGNPNFEIDQRNVGTGAPGTGNFALDRWVYSRTGSMSFSVVAQQDASTSPILLPGTNFAISQNFCRYTLATTQASLSAGDKVLLYQAIEGPCLRELIKDVHSLSLLVRSSVAGLGFGVSIHDLADAHSLVKLATITSANTWTLISLANLPLWVAGATWSIKPGNNGYYLYICLAAGSTFVTPANDTWQNGNFWGAIGQSNFAASSVNSTFDLAFVQHEPGVASTLQDKQFSQNLDECQRYYQKSHGYSIRPGSAVGNPYYFHNWVNGTNSYLAGNVPFKKVMAKTPIATIYNATTFAANNVRQVFTTTDYVVSSTSVNDSGITQIVTATGLPALSAVTGDYTADTGW